MAENIQERFDELAEGLATNRLSRWQVLKAFCASALLTGPFVSLLEAPAAAQSLQCTAASVTVCMGSAKKAYAKCKRRCSRLSGKKKRRCLRKCNTTFTSRSKACQCCPTPSRCGSRQFCSEDQTCICVQSAEGHNLCGKIPNTCDVKRCQTSADCADLGEGYFCDTPNSGCCSDGDQPRCIAPCEPPVPPCPAERVCGTECCSEEQVCLNGTCASATEDVCGSDPVTAESLDAARSALDAGSTAVLLSPGGCARYSRTVVAGRTTHEEVTINGVVVLAWDHTATQSTGQRDADRDGFFEWRSTVDRGPAGEFLRSVVTEHAPATGTLLRRETYTSAGGTVNVLWEEADEAGVLRIVASFDADPFEEAPTENNAFGRVSANGEDGAGAVGVAAISTTGCSPQQDDQLKARLRHAINVGLICMSHYGATSIQLNMMFHYVARDIVIKCDVLPSNVAARLDRNSWLDPESEVLITVNNDGFFTRLNEYEQSKTLWHEMLHNHFGPHNKKARQLPRFEEFDKTEACEDLCFGPDPTTKCSCARCLGTNMCDQRCRIHQECDPQMGAICPCNTGPNANRVFATCTDCLVTCPSGLGCFGFSTCIPIDVSCNTTPATCP